MSGGWGWAWDGEGGGIIGIGQFAAIDVPQSEANALIAFYDATSGDSWTNNTGWKTDPVVGNWYGVTVSGGHVTELDIHDNNLVGAAGNTLDSLAGHLTRLVVYNNSISTLDVSALTSLTYLACANNSISTLDVSALTSLTTLYCHSNSISTLDVSALTSLTILYCASNSISTLDLSSISAAVSLINCANNGMNQAAVDSIIDDIWQRRADFTDATPELHVGGTNATPSGTYQDGYPEPLDALEMVHDLINDDDGAGIQTWASITWNGGSAP